MSIETLVSILIVLLVCTIVCFIWHMIDYGKDYRELKENIRLLNRDTPIFMSDKFYALLNYLKVELTITPEYEYTKKKGKK